LISGIGPTLEEETVIVMIWFFRIISFPLGLACIFVSLDMLYVWGFDSAPPKRIRRPVPPPPRRGGAYRPGSQMSGRRSRSSHWARKRGIRPYPDAWVWWEWEIRHPAFYLLLLGIALIVVGVLMWWPDFGNIPWVSDHIEGIALLTMGLTLLRGTLKISSPLIWKRVTIIKRPLSGNARPSPVWMGIGLILCIVGLYGMACDFASPMACIGGDLTVIGKFIFAIGEFVLGGIGAVGLEDMIQSWQEGNPPTPRSLLLFGIGLVCFIAALIGQAALS